MSKLVLTEIKTNDNNDNNNPNNSNGNSNDNNKLINNKHLCNVCVSIIVGTFKRLLV